MNNTNISPFIAAFYNQDNREKIGELALPNLDSTQEVWGEAKSVLAFRNVLMGTAQERADTWRKWFAHREFEKTQAPVYFVACQKFVFAGTKYERWALLASIDINNPKLFIHENVYPEGVEQAKNGLLACQADLAPIFVGCEKKIEKKFSASLKKFSNKHRPLLCYQENTQSSHVLWKVSEPEWIEEFANLFHDSNLFLLDGHHRLMAAKKINQAGQGDGKILAFISSMSSKDLLILPVHRVISYARWITPEQMLIDLKDLGCKWKEKKQWHPEKFYTYLNEIRHGSPACLLLHSNTKTLWQIKFPANKEKAKKLEKISVRRLEKDILQKHPKMQILPTHSIDLAHSQLAAGQAQAAFFLPQLRAEDVQTVSLAQEVFPQKSTFFYPKPALGLVCRIWNS